MTDVCIVNTKKNAARKTSRATSALMMVAVAVVAIAIGFVATQHFGHYEVTCPYCYTTASM